MGSKLLCLVWLSVTPRKRICSDEVLGSSKDLLVVLGSNACLDFNTSIQLTRAAIVFIVITRVKFEN